MKLLQVLKLLSNKLVFIFVFFAFLFLSCEKNERKHENESIIDYSFFVAGHVYGSPGVDNAGVHPPFKNQFEYLKNDPTMKFGVFTGDIVPIGTENKCVDFRLISLNTKNIFEMGELEEHIYKVE